MNIQIKKLHVNFWADNKIQIKTTNKKLHVNFWTDHKIQIKQQIKSYIQIFFAKNHTPQRCNRLFHLFKTNTRRSGEHDKATSLGND
jgi:hypothetical protein